MRTSVQIMVLTILLSVPFVCLAQSPCPPPIPFADEPNWISFPSVTNRPDFVVSWDASTTTGAHYRVQIDSKPDFNNPQEIYDGDELSFEYEGCANGTYYLQILAYVPDSSCSMWKAGDHAICIDTTLPDPPAEPAAPTGLTVPSESGPAFTVTWTRLPAVVLYQLKQEYMFRIPMGYPVPTGWGFYQSTFSTAYDGANNSVQIAPVDCDDAWFKYQVRAYVMFHGHPIYGPWSDWSAEVTGINAPPGLSAMFSASGSTTGGTVTLSVSAGNGATSYEFEEDFSSDFKNPVQVFPVVGGDPQPVGWGNYVLSGKTDGTYFYRVRSVNGYGKSDWRPCSCGAVVTGCPAPAPPSAPQSLYVSPGQISCWIRLSWSGVAAASSYQVQEDTSPSFGNPVDVSSFWAQTYNTLSGRAAGTYYYRVRAVNSRGPSAWCNGSNPCVVSSFSAAAVIVRNSGTPSFRDIVPAASGVVALALDVRADPGRSVEFRTLTLSASGSADDCADIAMIRLYRDVDGDGVWTEGTDALIKGSGGFGSDNGTVVIQNINRLLAAGAAEIWFVVADFSGSAQGGENFTISVPYANDYPCVITAVDYQTGLPIGINGTPASGALITVYGDGTPGFMSVSASSAAPADCGIPAGSASVVMAAFEIFANERELVELYSVAFNGVGSGDESGCVSSAFLAEDVDGDGAYTASVDRKIDYSKIFSADDGTVVFDARGETIMPNGSLSLLLVYNFNTSAPAGATFRADLSAGSVQATGAVSLASIPADGLPLEGRTVTIASEDDGGSGDNPGCSAPASLSTVDSAGAMVPFLALGASIMLARLFRRRNAPKG